MKCIVAFCKFADASKSDMPRRQFQLKGEENWIVELNRQHVSRERIVQMNSGTLHYAERLVYVVGVRRNFIFVAGRPEKMNNLEDVS